MNATATRRVLVTGSRTWTDAETISLELERFDPTSTVIVHGACRDGADAMVQRFCHNCGYETERHPADWKKHGKAAGPRRNREMVESLDPETDLVLAFWDGKSTGTLGTIELARDRGVPVRVFRPDGTTY